MKVAIAQVNPTVGDLAGNRRLVEEAAAKAAEERADLVLLPEMVLTGYPPMDLLERQGFVDDQVRELEALRPASERVAIALGAVLPWEEGRPNKLVNAAVLLAGGEQVAVRPKSLLPTYDVFDERRHFTPADFRQPAVLPDSGTAVGLAVCEDTWVDRMPYDIDPPRRAGGGGRLGDPEPVLLAVARRSTCQPPGHARRTRGRARRSDRVREPGRRQRRG